MTDHQNAPRQVKNNKPTSAGIRRVLVLGLAGLLTVAGSISAIIIVQAAGAEAETQLLAQHRVRFDGLVTALEFAAVTDPDRYHKIITSGARHDTRGIALLDAQLQPVVQKGAITNITRDEIVLAANGSHRTTWRRAEVVSGATEHRFARRLSTGSAPLTLYAVYDLGTLHRDIRARQFWVLVYLVFGLVVLLLFGAFLSGRFIVGPLEKLTALAQGSDGTQGEDLRFKEVGGPREIQRLSSEFENLIERLSQRNEDLASHMNALEAARDELIRTEKMAIVGRLSAGMAHEIGNPLASVVGFLDYLRSDEDITPALRQELLDRMDREVARIRTTLRHLLDFGRPTPDEPRGILISDVVENTLEVVRYHSQMKTVTVEITGSAALAWMDPNKLGQVLTNLFLNAAAAMNGQGQIHVEMTETESCARLRIWDEGPGIPEEQSSQVFEPFFSTKPEGIGTGLGLFVSQRVMEDAGGSLRLLRLAPESALFQLTVPFAVQEDGEGLP